MGSSTLNKLARFSPHHGLRLANNIMKLYGKPFFFLNTSIFFAQVGIILNSVKVISLPYYQAAGVTGQTLTEMAAVGSIPWTCKGFFGLVADLIPLFGRQKLYYVIIYITLGLACCATLAFMPFSVPAAVPIVSALLFFGYNTSSASCDLLIEAKYIELMQKNPGIRADLLSFARFCETCGQLIPTALVGVLADMADVRIAFMIIFPILLTPIPSLMYGGMIDDVVPKHKSNRFNVELYKSQWKLVILTGFQFLTSMGTVVITAIADSTVQMIYMISIAIILNTLAFILLDLRTAKYFLFLYICQATYFNLQGGLEYYYTAAKDCAPDGPQFSYFITSSVGPLFQTIAAFLGIFVFQVVFTDWKFHTVYWTSTLLRILASGSDLILVKGWNRVLHIPDVVVFVLGYSTFSHLAYIINSITNSYMISKLSPKSFEATMFALQAASAHIGTASAAYFGVYLMDLFGIQTKIDTELGLECDFTNLPWLILIGHAVFPLLSIISIFFLVPDVRLYDTVLTNYDPSATHINTKSLQEIVNNK